MQIKIGSIIFILAIALTHMVNAQSTKPIIKQTIIIQKNSDSADKMLIKVDGNQMTINGKPVNDKVIDSILSTINGDKEKKMTVTVNGDNIIINGKAVNDKSLQNKFMESQGGNEEKIIIIKNNGEEGETVERKIIINSNQVDASERNIIINRDGKTVYGNGFNGDNPERVQLRVNRNRNDMPKMLQLHAEQPRIMLGVMVGKADNGLIISDVVKGSLAELAGLKVGDVITAFSNTKLSEPKQLVDSVQTKKIGDEIKLTVIKAGEKKETNISIKLTKESATKKVSIFVEDEGPNDDGAIIEKDIQRQLREIDFGNDQPGRKIFIERMHSNDAFSGKKKDKPSLGIHVQEMADSSGVKVFKVIDGSLAAISGIKENDIIVSIDGKKVANINFAMKQMEAIKDKANYQLKIKRKGAVINIDVVKKNKLKKAIL
jgi:C-terminal processing protease CtpA/Prc